MKRVCLYIIILYSVLLMVGCSDNSGPTIPEPQPGPVPRAEAERTVIVYMVADNSPYLPASQDTTEMMRGKEQIPEDVNFIIYLDDKNLRPAIYELSAKKGMQLWKRYDEEQGSTNASVMLSVLREIEHYFPARHYGITFWSHATGWAPERKKVRQKTFGKDEDFGTTPATGKIEMEIPDMRDALASLPRFDYIFFDACFMQCIEVAYELRGVTDWMIGSPAEIPGPGAPYDKIIGAMCKGDATGIVRGYADGYPGTYNRYTYPGVLLSCIDCTKLEPLAIETGKLLRPFYKDRTEPSTSGFQFYSTTINKYTYCFDMRTTMCRLLSEEDYAAWQVLFDQAVPLYTVSDTHVWFANTISPAYATNGVARLADPECYGGVSMFVPMSDYDSYGWNEDFQKTAWYAATGWSATGW